VSPFLLAQTDLVGAATPDLLPSIWRMLGGLAVVLALLGGLAWLLRRGGLARRAAGGFGVESALPLGERRSLIIVTVEGRRLLLGLAPHQISLVSELAPAPPSFDAAVSRALDQEAR
jgi:flagellar protein FliO/FliZ